MRANDFRSSDVVRHGAYACLHVSDAVRRTVAAAGVAALVERLGLRNEFEAGDGHPSEAVAFLRRVSAKPADIMDAEVLRADVIVHVASTSAAPVATFCAELTRLLEPTIKPYVLAGVVRPTSYTGNAMHNFAYAHQVIQQTGTVMPNAFLIPMSKTAEWWAKDWMQRHTYFLPRYDDTGRVVNEGHALAAAAGIESLMRRTYRNQIQPAPAGAYDFVNYFECADADIQTFHEVCANLRDVTKNPEWRFVREGPTWHGRRARQWAELFD